MASERQRIDKWLFFARVVKSRTLAAKLVQGGKVRVNGEKIAQASQDVKPGDVLTVTLDRRIVVHRVVDCGERRGPAAEARTLYEDLSPPPPPRGESALDRVVAKREPGSGRPTKKERRALDRLSDVGPAGD
ncbi:RNA-binding S4 domain-containing protein [Oricola cellulosilytica]|uniref:RNA-binding S4 domain-containing protein n=1 Tax=Oricola cellulosilytica TaxID=1429082 RepID=A0A4R0PBQ1_9HYPH|nr:RNA-binding S4 domain-containing protein [Oricola cellulosilytica]TCD13777.1 RNA-binding S4 domain-containing protein [Oricola cellulosilytica]